ncbi:TraD N-terminal domain-containing protein [Escherichia coli]|uniref:TraD N-terminal domain-containing protein n=1 Tax=Escherichia coli TaxID=562 RepID=UPI001BCCAFB6|nr:TraD N-terminal domain-containing protein [Escherichia coli]MBS4234541.1 hypothetical protein [Escherichia coli]
MSFNAKDMTQGGQIASMRIRMFSQIANIMLYCLFIFFWILVGLVLWVKISWQTFVNGCIYWWCTTLQGMRDLIKSQPVYEIQYYGKTFRMNAAQVLHDKYMIWCGEQLWSAFVLATVVALVICLITFFVVFWILGRQGKQQSENEVTGGRQLTDNPKDVARMLKKDGKDSDIRIGDLPIIRDSDIQSLPDLTCYVTLPGPYPAVKLSLKYQTRPKVAPEFIPRDINPEMENRLSAVLAAREAEGRQMASLFEPDVPEVVSGEDVTQAEQPQQPVSPAINDKKSDSGVNVPAGGIEQELKMKPEEEMEQQLPPGISESGEVVDMAAYEAWQQENHPDIQQQMQRREEVNINVHRERGEDVEPGDDF